MIVYYKISKKIFIFWFEYFNIIKFIILWKYFRYSSKKKIIVIRFLLCYYLMLFIIKGWFIGLLYMYDIICKI